MNPKKFVHSSKYSVQPQYIAAVTYHRDLNIDRFLCIDIYNIHID